VGGVGGGDAVGFPDIHLRAASTHSTNARVGVAIRGFPSLNVALSKR
jgi:hypothetical protein